MVEARSVCMWLFFDKNAFDYLHNHLNPWLDEDENLFYLFIQKQIRNVRILDISWCSTPKMKIPQKNHVYLFVEFKTRKKKINIKKREKGVERKQIFISATSLFTDISLSCTTTIRVHESGSSFVSLTDFFFSWLLAWYWIHLALKFVTNFVRC